MMVVCSIRFQMCFLVTFSSRDDDFILADGVPAIKELHKLEFE